MIVREQATGLRAIVADIAGPLVNGYFALATESHCDDGCPHTLEHLIFLGRLEARPTHEQQQLSACIDVGSEDYPWKGVLDELSNRSLAQGTNAWTDTYSSVVTTPINVISSLPTSAVQRPHVLYRNDRRMGRLQ